MKAVWRGEVLAESDATRVIEGNHYFPPESLREQFFAESGTRSHCFWKGEASYFHVRVGEDVNRDAAWTYREPLPAAHDIAGYIGFWNGVRVTS